jgi:hypothetical protein
MQRITQSTTDVRDDQLLDKVVDVLLKESREGADERRAEYRDPYFVPVRVTFPGGNGRQFSCFSRDVSVAGMGLLHYMELARGEVVLTIPSKSFGDVRIHSEIIWCRPCGEGWYMSGVQFIALLAAERG